MYSTDHKQLNTRLGLTREGGASARERSMQYLWVQYECVHMSASTVRVHARECE